VREKYCWLVAGGWFVLREKYCWLVADKPNEQAASSHLSRARTSTNVLEASACTGRPGGAVGPGGGKDQKVLPGNYVPGTTLLWSVQAHRSAAAFRRLRAWNHLRGVERCCRDGRPSQGRSAVRCFAALVRRRPCPPPVLQLRGARGAARVRVRRRRRPCPCVRDVPARGGRSSERAAAS
jgi:hypothetical protein